MGNWGVAIGRYLKARYALALAAVWIVMFIEFLNRGQVWGLFKFAGAQAPAFLLNVAIVFGALLFFASVTGRTRAAFWIVSSIGLPLGLISGIKLKMLGVPLLPWDFVLTGEGTDMAQYLSNVFSFKLIAGIVVFYAAGWLLLYKNGHVLKKIGWKERAAVAVASVCLIAAVYSDKPVPVKKAFHISAITYDQSYHVSANGLLLSMMLNLDYMKVDRMQDYNDKAIAAIVDSGGSVKAGAPDSVKPNIIVVLSESLWDPTQLKTVKFSRDPMPFFHELQQKTRTGTLLSPQFGGGTANVEFEVLTGNSMRFLPQGSIPYNQFINHGIDSLASILARQGYVSTAISPFHNWFFNSKKVYQNFGFGKYISLEFFDPVYEGPYIADSEVAKVIIEETRKTPERDFIFANTMENHFHYYPGKFKENTIKVEGDIPPDTRGMLETYAQGTQDADKMLKTLVEHYKNAGEPTIIVFFGDHLPYLGDEYKAYKDSKWITGEDDPDFLNKMYRVPVVVWDNYMPERKETIDLSPSFLGPYVLELAKLPGTYFTDHLRELSKKYPVIPPKNYYAAMNIDEADLKRYELLQYDILFGERHGYGELKDKIVNPNFVMGFGPMEIVEVLPNPLKAGGEATLTVKGKNFPALGVVHLNGKPLQTERGADGSLTAKVAGSALKPGAAADVQVKVIDSKEFVVAESNVYKVQIEQ